MPDAQVCGAKKPSSTPNGKMLDIVISREKMAAGLFAALAAALMYFLTKLIAARWKFVALQRTKMVCPNPFANNTNHKTLTMTNATSPCLPTTPFGDILVH